MLTVDTRAGSKELIDPLSHLGVSVSPGILAAGDIEFLGNGPEGPAVVLVEHKKLGDLFQCIRDGRFADQLRGMRSAGEFNWLLIEGKLRGYARGSALQMQKSGGRWEHVRAGMTYQEMIGWTITMCAVAGVMVWRTENQEESVAWIHSLYNWWTAKEWSKHRAHAAFYDPPVTEGNPFEKPTLAHEIAFKLPLLGQDKSYKAAKHFRSTKKMINASEAEWIEVDGVGKRGAKVIVEAINSEK